MIICGLVTWFVAVRMTGLWPDVCSASWSTDDRMCGWAWGCCIFSRFVLFFLLQYLFQLLACCTTMTVLGLARCTAASCCRQKCLQHTWPLQTIVFKWRQNIPSIAFASWSRIDTTWMRCATLGPVMLINRKFDMSRKLDISRPLSTFASQLHSNASWSFAAQSRWYGGGGFVGLIPSETKLQVPSNWNIKHHKTVMFVQISECQAPMQKCKAPLWNLRRLCCGFVATPSFSLAISFVTMVRY